MFTYVTLLLCGVLTKQVSVSVLAVFCGVLLFVRYLQILRTYRTLPPGPWGLPILGSLPFLKGDLHIYFRDLGYRYGSFFSTRLGSQLFVVLSDYKLIRDAFRKEEFTGRPSNEFTDILGGYGEYFFLNTSEIICKILTPKSCIYISYAKKYIFCTRS